MGVRAMKTYKSLAIIDNEDYAFLENNRIYINIEKLWNENPKADVFIEEFTLSHTHELLHLTLWEIDEDGDAMGEEKTIRSLLGEEWNEKLEWIYEGEVA